MNEWIVILTYLFFGIAAIWIGSNMMVDGVKGIALNMGIPAVVVSYTLVAFGTSIPELLVGIEASAMGKISVTAGNIASSQLINGLVMLGLAGSAGSMRIDKYVKPGQSYFLAGATIALGVIIMSGRMERLYGVGLLAAFFGYAVYTVRDIIGHLKKSRGREDGEKTGKPAVNAMKSIFGIVLLFIGGRLLIEGATGFAAATGLASGLIGFTIVTLGTTAPEIISSFVALKKGRIDILIGCGVGSAIFNPLFISGLSALINTGSASLDTKPEIGLVVIIAGVVTGLQMIVLKELNKRFTVISLLLFAAAMVVAFYG
ncbi:MAG: sodium:calcium antiporter [Spirochaetia bacterium]|nr:sodium:calcium antiporter [Spirochaetia bacterium]